MGFIPQGIFEASTQMRGNRNMAKAAEMSMLKWISRSRASKSYRTIG